MNQTVEHQRDELLAATERATIAALRTERDMLRVAAEVIALRERVKQLEIARQNDDLP